MEEGAWCLCGTDEFDETYSRSCEILRSVGNLQMAHFVPLLTICTSRGTPAQCDDWSSNFRVWNANIHVGAIPRKLAFRVFPFAELHAAALTILCATMPLCS